MTSTEDSVRFALWNTSLAPPGNSRGDISHYYEFALDQIEFLLSDVDVDFLALLEVSEDECKAIYEKFSNGAYEVVDALDRAGRTYFDLCLIYNKSKLSLGDRNSIITSHKGRSYKVAQQLSVTHTDGTIFHVLISHWPSRILAEPTEETRSIIGHHIGLAAQNIVSESDALPFIVLMGDYNAEPYSNCIREALGTSRDVNMVQRNSRLFYNPFWDFLPHSDDSQTKGSHYHSGDYLDKWRVFDQIIYSSAFFNNESAWRYNHSGTSILPSIELHSRLIDRNSIFDHAPVTGLIEKRSLP